MAEVFDKLTITTDDLGEAKETAPAAVTAPMAPTGLEEFRGWVEVFEEAGFVVAALEMEAAGGQQLVAHFRVAHDAGRAAQQRLLERHADKPVAAMLEALLGAADLAASTHLDKLQLAEFIVEMTSPPKVRVAWREEVTVQAGAAKAVRAKVVGTKATKAKETKAKAVEAKVVGTASSKAVEAIPVRTAKKKPAGD
ncbi:MAG: hypothetical protein CL483_01395 [Acidobacteria bacterium]|nr:hypothetical protein [Acidobacteriota bacterium]